MRQLRVSPVRMNSAEKIPIFWCQERRTIRDILEQECSCRPERQSPPPTLIDSRPLLVRSHCLKKSCRCILRQEGALVLKCARDVGLIQGSWVKAASKSSSTSFVPSSYPPTISTPSTDKHVSCLVLSTANATWFEVLNESGQAVPYWTQVREIVKYQPAQVLLRKDLKCIFARNNPSTRTYELHSEDSGVIKAGSVLTYLEFNHFHVVKSKSKLKEVPLLKCCESSGQLIFLHPDDKCVISPVAGPDNISGVHSIQSVLQKFQLPIGIRPVLGGLASWLPNSDRHSLRLSNCFQNNLIFLEALSGIGRFFVVTADMLDDHVFSLGESESPLHLELMDRHVQKVRQFLVSCHPVDGLQYLLRHMMDTSRPCSCPEEVKQQRRLSSSTGGGEANEEVHQLLDEIEEIYFYVRTGRFPSSSKSVNSLATTFNTKAPPSPGGHNSQQAPQLSHHRSCQQLTQDQPLALAPSVSPPPVQTQISPPHGGSSRQKRSSSCDHLCDTTSTAGAAGTRLPPPPLPPRLYFSGCPAAALPSEPSSRPGAVHTPRRPSNADYATVMKPLPPSKPPDYPRCLPTGGTTSQMRF